LLLRLSIATVAFLLMGLMLMFWIGIEVGVQGMVSAENVERGAVRVITSLVLKMKRRPLRRMRCTRPTAASGSVQGERASN
jgi:hypothetical protein